MRRAGKEFFSLSIFLSITYNAMKDRLTNEVQVRKSIASKVRIQLNISLCSSSIPI